MADHDHHVVPRSKGGTATVPLCCRCHGLAHGVQMGTPALTRMALRRKKARGERVGGIPYGYQVAADGVHLVRHEGEQLALSALRDCRAAGLSLRAIASELAKRGLLTRRGRPFAPSSVKRMLEKEY